jgi:predicted DNA-binding transcriptional regulator AlpA
VVLRKTRSLHEQERIEDNGERSKSGEWNVDQQLLIGAKELAGIMDVSTRTLWRLLSKGELIKPIRVGGNTRWRMDDIRRWIEAGCPPPDGDK